MFNSDQDRTKEGYRASIVVPLIARGEVVGTLSLRSRRIAAFGEQEQAILERLANQIAPAVENSRLYQNLQSSTEEQAEANEKLLLEVAERKRAEANLEQARDVALEATQAKNVFLANMSHELRTPLNAIIGYAEMLQEQAEDLNQGTLIPDLTKFQSAGKHLMELINDVFDLSSVEAGKMELYLETTLISELVNGVLGVIHPLVGENGNTLKINWLREAGSLRADKTKVRQILLNLLRNACKFIQEGSITVEVDRKTQAGVDWIWVRVTDTGIGITPEQMDMLYQPITQADSSTTRRYGGTGLGLALSRKFCHLMGGDLTVESQVDEGSTFTFTLPANVVDPSEETVL